MEKILLAFATIALVGSVLYLNQTSTLQNENDLET